MATLGIATLETEIDLRGLDRDLARADQKTKGGLQALQGSTDKLLTGLAVGLGNFAIQAATKAIAAVKQFVGESLQEFTTFEQGLDEVFTLLPGMSQDAMGAMQADVLDLAGEIGRLPQEIIPALYQSLSAGVPPENVFDFLTTANQAAIGGVTSLETAVDGITSVVNAYGAEMITAGAASDLMFTAVKGGKTTFDELAGSLFNVIPTAASVGLEFGNVTAALAAMTAQGTPTATATTQLRQLLVELTREGTAASDTFKQLAGSSVPEFLAQGGNLQGVLQIMEQGAQAAGLRLSDLFSSVEAGNAALSLTGAGADKFTLELQNAEQAAGATATAAGQFAGGLAEAERFAGAATQELKILIGEALGPTKKAWLELKTSILESAIAALEQTRAVQAQREESAGLQDQLGDLIRENDSLSASLGNSADASQATGEALEFIRGATELYGSEVEGAQIRNYALKAALDLVRAGFQGTGTDLALAALQLAEVNLAADVNADRWATIASVYAEAAEAGGDLNEVMGQQVAGAIATDQSLQQLAASERELSTTTQAEIYAAQQAAQAREEYRASIEAATQAVRDHEAFITGAFATAVEDEKRATEAGTTVQHNWVQALYDAASQMDLSETQITLLAAATGNYTQEQIEAALKTAAMRAKVQELAQQLAEGKTTVDNAISDLRAFERSLEDSTTDTASLGGAAIDTAGKLEALAGDYEVTVTANTAAAEAALARLEAKLAGLLAGEDPTATGGPSATGGHYALGGYTGRGASDQVAGLVHKNEYVLPPHVVNSIGVENLDRLVAGGQPSGLAGNTIYITIAADDLAIEDRVYRAIDLALAQKGQRADMLIRSR